jgi:hypothetical protein
MKALFGLLAVLVPWTALAQDPIDGTWRIDLKTTEYIGTETYSLDQGQFQCPTCEPKINVKADGADHAVAGSPNFDTVAVRVVNPQTAEITYKQKGKPWGTEILTVSQDGRTLTHKGTNKTPSGETASGSYTSTRVGQPPAAGSSISGKWQPGHMQTVSDNASEMTYKMAGDQLTYRDKVGNSYSAALDGKDYPFKGDPAVSTVSVRRVNAKTIDETLKRDGKVLAVNHMRIAPDGKTMSVTTEDKLRNVSYKATWDKQ